jgi:hypothetical protein
MRWIAALLLAAALGWQWFPDRPEYFLQSDSGVWVHIARRMLEGARPYVDIWDHKPPGILWIHAAALFLTGGKLWGIWLAAVASLACALWISAKLAAERFGGTMAGWLAMAWTSTCFALWLDHVDYTEVFALPIQAALLWLALRERGSGRWAQWEGALAGVLTASTILLRPNLAGTGIVVLAFAGPHVWMTAAASASGVLLAALLPAWSGGWLQAMIDAVWRFNIDYSGWSSRNRLSLASEFAVTMVAAGPAASGALGLWFARRRKVAWTLAAVAVVELALGLVGGKAYGHYYVLVGVPACILAAAAWDWAGEATARKGCLCGFAFLAFIHAARPFAVDAARNREGRSRTASALAADQVRRLSGPGARVLTWDGHHWAQSLTGRREAARHFYWVKLYVGKGWEIEVLEGLSAALRSGEVEFVAEGSREYNPFPPIPREERMHLNPNPATAAIADYIQDHFEVVSTGNDFRIWRKRPVS